MMIPGTLLCLNGHVHFTCFKPYYIPCVYISIYKMYIECIHSFYRQWYYGYRTLTLISVERIVPFLVNAIFYMVNIYVFPSFLFHKRMGVGTRRIVIIIFERNIFQWKEEVHAIIVFCLIMYAHRVCFISLIFDFCEAGNNQN